MPTMRGYAIKFHSRSVDLGGFIEVITPEAVSRTLREKIDVRMLVNHDTRLVLGRLSAGTLRLGVDAHGLSFEVDTPSTQPAQDALELVRRGDVNAMSFGFRTLEDDWRMEGGELVRHVLDMRVSEISLVSFPAYASTTAAVRSAQPADPAPRGTSIAFMKLLHRQRLAG